MIPSGLTSSVISRANLGDGYVRVSDRQIVDAVAEFLYERENAVLKDPSRSQPPTARPAREGRECTRQWGRPAIRWYPGSHMGFLVRLPDAIAEARRFIDELLGGLTLVDGR